MDRADPEKRPDEEVRDDDKPIFCPRCAIKQRIVIVILDTSKGTPARLFRCECGELIWDDDALRRQ